MLTVHSHNFSYIRKNDMTLVCRLEALAQRSRKEATQSRRGKLTEDQKSFKHACNQIAVSQRPVSSRGQPLTPTVLRRMGNCPPPARAKVASVPRARAGRATRAIRVLSWNAGHLGKSWLSTEASQTCDVLLLQETHWQATAEFSASGWYCVSSASPDDTLKATKSKKGRGGTAHIAQEAEARPESSQDQTRQVPPWSGQTRQEEATQSRRARLTQHSGTAPRHIWVQSQSGRACCAMGGGLRLRPSQLCSLLTQPSLRPIAASPELPSVGRH